MGIFRNLFDNDQKTTENSKKVEITFCPNCGFEGSNKDANYCTFCGYNLKKENEIVTLICPECGQLYEDETTICPICNKLLISLTDDPLYDDFMKEYAVTLVLWAYDKPRELMNNNSIPVYYTYECKITNIELLQREMIENGLLKHPDSVEMLQVLKTDQLKDILRENDLLVSGRKDELINRIVDSKIDTNIYNNTDDYYVISKSGEIFLDKHQEYIELHRNWKYRITTREYYEMKKRILEKSKYCSFRDCVWGIFQQRLLGNLNKKAYLQLYFNYENMADFTYNEGRYDVAVQLYVKCVIYELCGVHYYDEYNWFVKDMFSKDMLIDFIKGGTLYSNNINSLIKCKECFSKDMIAREYNHLEMNFKLCSLEFIEKIVDEAMNDSMFNLDDYKELVKRERLSNIKKYI